MHRNKTNLNKLGKCNQAAENTSKERETQDAKQGKSEGITSFSSWARRLWPAEQVVLRQPGCLLVQGHGLEEEAKQARP